MDWIVTGASRGIGRSLALALARKSSPRDRLFVLARDEARLRSLTLEAAAQCAIEAMTFDLGRLSECERAAEALIAQDVRDATLVHNAGLWPTERALVDGFEAAYAVNALGPLVLQRPLLDQRRLRRVLVVSAGLAAKGRFDLARTPTGEDFSKLRTYCTTKLAGAIAQRHEATRHPAVDFAVIHPGVVRTDLGATSGVLGWLLQRVKRRWESPEACAERLVRVLDRQRWQPREGVAPWLFEEDEAPWPEAANRDRDAVLAAIEAQLANR
ncbi:MAG: SDR family NAD(P)-dependent oxidoreductase [Myxococcales bacterium]|nr:SDR family NAD(P)-dependent oxidoreductase [Myxococcales bacterium]